MIRIEWKPVRRFQDPYYLKGKEKTDELTRMYEYIEWFDHMSNPSQHEKELYYLACMFLEAEATRRAAMFANSEKMYRNRKIKIVNEALDEFKTRQKAEFMERFEKEIAAKEITPQLIVELNKLNNMDKYGCYIVHDLKVTKRDCSACDNKICQRRGEL